MAMAKRVFMVSSPVVALFAPVIPFPLILWRMLLYELLHDAYGPRVISAVISMPLVVYPLSNDSIGS
jgi:hypothetical protein